MERRLVLAALPIPALLMLFGTFALNVPLQVPHCPCGTLAAQGAVYSYETISVSVPSLFADGVPTTVSNGGVIFTLGITGWGSGGGGALAGSGEEATGITFPISVLGIPSGHMENNTYVPDFWNTWLSPDGLFGVQWNLYDQARLLVIS